VRFVEHVPEPPWGLKSRHLLGDRDAAYGSSLASATRLVVVAQLTGDD
jgi:hypothetical protein